MRGLDQKAGRALTVCAGGGLTLAAAMVLGPCLALAETQISVYGGLNTNFKSPVTMNKSGVTDDRTIEWEGKSFQTPPYWGVRGTYWLGNASHWGLAIDFTHAKAYADLDFASDPTYSRLEFTDGNNLVTLNLMYRLDPVLNGTLVPYVGIGAGVAIPHVEVALKAYPDERTFEYQLAGPAAQGIAGVEYRLSDAWSLFAEAKLSYSHLDTDLTGGGSLKTYLWSPHIAVGLSYRFGADW